MNQCIYCHSHSCLIVYPTSDLWGNKYYIAYCNVCKAYFLTPIPSKEVLNMAYDESYYGCSEKKFKGSIEKVLDFFRKQRAKQISKLLPPKGSILDIGCGNGNFLMSMLNYGQFSLFGSELEGKSAQRASQNKEIHLITEPLTLNTFAINSFDAVTMFHVFEHLSEPKKILDLIKLFLKVDGYFIVSFPNIGSWQSLLFKGKWLHLDPPRHLFFFKTDDFELLMKQEGFELVKKKFFSVEQNPYGFIQSLLNVFQKKREVLFESLKGNTSYTSDYNSFQIFIQKVAFVFLFPFAVLGDAIASFFGKGATVEFTFRKLKNS